MQDASHSAVILFYEEFKITHLQFQLQVFSLSFCSVQWDSQWRLHLGTVHFAGEVDLQLIVVNWKTDQQLSTI